MQFARQSDNEFFNTRCAFMPHSIRVNLPVELSEDDFYPAYHSQNDDDSIINSLITTPNMKSMPNLKL